MSFPKKINCQWGRSFFSENYLCRRRPTVTKVRGLPAARNAGDWHEPHGSSGTGCLRERSRAPFGGLALQARRLGCKEGRSREGMTASTFLEL